VGRLGLGLGLGLVLVLRLGLGLGLALWLQLGIGIGFRRNHSWSSTFMPRHNHRLCLKGEVKRFLHGDLICTYTLSEYISDIYVDGLCIISVKLNFETHRDSARHYLFTAT